MFVETNPNLVFTYSNKSYFRHNGIKDMNEISLTVTFLGMNLDFLGKLHLKK